MYLSVYKYMEQGKFDKGLVILDGNEILRRHISQRGIKQ